jgi:hypothetical protein
MRNPRNRMRGPSPRCPAGGARGSILYPPQSMRPLNSCLHVDRPFSTEYGLQRVVYLLIVPGAGTGIAASAGSCTNLKRVGNLGFPFAFQSVGSSSIPDSRWGYVVATRRVTPRGLGSGTMRHAGLPSPSTHKRSTTNGGRTPVENGLPKCKRLEYLVRFRRRSL